MRQRLPPRLFQKVVLAAAEHKVQHRPLHEQVALVFLGQADAAVQLDRFLGYEAIGVAGQGLERSHVGERRSRIGGA
ncbi:MAG: hypothetical protein V9E98_04590 [Candidatus Nanopelagicales bacterium]